MAQSISGGTTTPETQIEPHVAPSIDTSTDAGEVNQTAEEQGCFQQCWTSVCDTVESIFNGLLSALKCMFHAITCGLLNGEESTDATADQADQGKGAESDRTTPDNKDATPTDGQANQGKGAESDRTTPENKDATPTDGQADQGKGAESDRTTPENKDATPTDGQADQGKGAESDRTTPDNKDATPTDGQADQGKGTENGRTTPKNDGGTPKNGGTSSENNDGNPPLVGDKNTKLENNKKAASESTTKSAVSTSEAKEVVAPSLDEPKVVALATDIKNKLISGGVPKANLKEVPTELARVVHLTARKLTAEAAYGRKEPKHNAISTKDGKSSTCLLRVDFADSTKGDLRQDKLIDQFVKAAYFELNDAGMVPKISLANFVKSNSEYCRINVSVSKKTGK